MKVKLLRDARLLHRKGEIVEVSPFEYAFLTSTDSAVAVEEKKAEPKTEVKAEEAKPEKKTKKK